MAKPSADGVDASHAGPARGDDASEAGPSAGNSVPHGVVEPSAASSSSTAVAVAAADHPHINRIREQDHFLPVANVICIMRRVLPMHAKISDGAKEMMQECLTEYISFITGEANERCKREQCKTITAEDVIWAMERLGFDNYVGPLCLLSQYWAHKICFRRHGYANSWPQLRTNINSTMNRIRQEVAEQVLIGRSAIVDSYKCLLSEDIIKTWSPLLDPKRAVVERMPTMKDTPRACMKGFRESIDSNTLSLMISE